MNYFSELRNLLLFNAFFRSLHQLKSVMILCKSAVGDRKEGNVSTQHINRIAAKGNSGGREV